MRNSPTEAVAIAHGMAESQRERAAALYMEAFRPLLGPLLGDDGRARRLLARCLNPSRAIVATCGGQLAGLAGFQDAQGSLFELRLRTMTATYGIPGGTARLAVLSLLLARRKRPGTLFMDGIAVAPELRGCGIGTQLLAAICEHARAAGYRYVGLDVLDTNPRARALYGRMGFVPVRHETLPFLKRFFGFSGVTEMHKPLSRPG